MPAPTCSRAPPGTSRRPRRPPGILYERLHRLLHSLGRPAGGDRARDPRHDPGHRVAPAPRAGERAGDQAARRWPPVASDCPPPARASATPRAWPAPRAGSGPTSTCPTATRWPPESTTRSRGWARCARRSDAADAARITDWNDGAGADRRRLLEAQLAGGPLFELRASVPNRPGVVAQLALELGRAGVNITDMALYPALDMSEGVIALWIAGEEQARRTEELVGSSRLPGGAGMNTRFEPSGPLRGTIGVPRRQVDLPPRGAARCDGLGAGADPQLPRRGRHPLDPGRDRAARRDRGGPRGRAPDPRLRDAQRDGPDEPDRRRQRRHADAPAPGLAVLPAGP